MEQYQVKAAKMLQGIIAVPGDEAISHRAIMLSALAKQPVVIKNFSFSQNCLSVIECFRKMDIVISYSKDADRVWVAGNGLHGLQEPDGILDAGHSGTALCLLPAILAGQNYFSVLTCDDPLRQQSLADVLEPLTKMGAQLYGRAKNRKAPIAILSVPALSGGEFKLEAAGSQVKSALLLAGLYALEPVVVTESCQSRDHTERMLASFGAEVAVEGLTVTLYPPQSLTAPEEIVIPGDISLAAYWLVAASIIPNSCITLNDVGINVSRAAIIEALQKMGANIEIKNRRFCGREEVADITVVTAPLHGAVIQKDMIPRLIDEIQVLAVAALFASGTTRIEGVYERKIEEMDLLADVTGELTKLGAKFVMNEDGLIIHGPQQLTFAVCHSRLDHRVAMAIAVAGLAGQGAEINEAGCVQLSYPEFFGHLEKLSL